MKTLRLLGLFCWLILFGLHFPSLAMPVTRDQALRAAVRWHAITPNPMRKPVGKIAKITSYSNAAGEALFHVVDLEPTGFVVMSADDRVEPVLAFSHQGKFVGQPGNPLYDLLLRDTGERIRALKADPATRRLFPRVGLKEKAKWEMLTTTAPAPVDSSGVSSVDDECVAPLTQSLWDQSTVWTGNSSVAVYNYDTPPYAPGNLNNYVCGCVATAWAQIMRYYQWPVTGVGTQSFGIWVDGTSENQPLLGGDGAGGPYDWADMVLVPGSGITPQQCQAIGALTADAGVANDMSYTADASGAYLSSSAITNVFHYANAAYSTADLADMLVAIRTNLDSGMPVALAIWNSSEGHEVVCDGYGYNQSTLYHHINMGWSGEDNLWYNLPTIYIFDTIAGCTYNINPTATGEIISGRLTDSNGAPIPGATVSVAGPTVYTGTTNQEGIYAFSGLPSNNTWTVTPSATGYLFSPAQATVSTGYSTDYSPIGDATADFAAFAGSLQVTISPAGAVSAGALWNVDNGMWQTSGATVGVPSPGNHTVNFLSVSGWTAPASQSVIVTGTQAAAATVTGTYVFIPEHGSLSVTILPTAAVKAGATWNVDGGSWQSSGATVDGLLTGSHTVNFSAGCPSYSPPASQNVTVTENQTAAATGTYAAILSTITVDYPAGTPLISGSGIIDCGTSFTSATTSLTFEVLNNTSTNLVLSGWSLLGANASDFNTTLKVPELISAGHNASFVLTFCPQAAGIRAATLQLASNDPVTPLFNISLAGAGISFAQMAGAYVGWTGDALLSLTMTNTGAFTGKLLLNGEPISIKGTFGANGTFSGPFGKPSVPVTLTLGPTGIAASAGGVTLTTCRTQSSVEKVSPEAGKYTFLLTEPQPSATLPAGTGYGTLTVSVAGSVNVTGKLADGTAFSAKGLMMEDGTCDEFAIYVPTLYKGQGYLSGLVGFSGSGTYTCDGAMEWRKPKQSSTSGYYPAGFDATLNLSGAPYVMPPKRTAALPFSEGVVEISGGSIGNPITDTVELSSFNSITVSDANPAKLKLTVTAATGSLTGSFVHPLTSKTVNFGGVLVEDSTNSCAAGFFLGPIISGTGSAGSIILTPAP